MSKRSKALELPTCHLVCLWWGFVSNRGTQWMGEMLSSFFLFFSFLASFKLLWHGHFLYLLGYCVFDCCVAMLQWPWCDRLIIPFLLRIFMQLTGIGSAVAACETNSTHLELSLWEGCQCVSQKFNKNLNWVDNKV